MNSEYVNHQPTDEEIALSDFSADRDEISFLERLQTDGRIGEHSWSAAHAERLKSLREQRVGLSEIQKTRFNELSKLQALGVGWTEELSEEIRDLYTRIDKRESR